MVRLDAIFYNLGDDARFHQGIWQVARECPGFPVMHDVMMRDSVAFDHRQRHDRRRYLEMMQSLYGARGHNTCGISALVSGPRPEKAVSPFQLGARSGALRPSRAPRSAWI